MRCQKAPHGTDETIASIAPTMIRKLNTYQMHMNSPSARFSKILDPYIMKNLDSNGVFLRNQVQLPEPPQSPRHQRKGSLLDELLVNDSCQDNIDYEISQLFRATGWADSKTDVLACWKMH